MPYINFKEENYKLSKQLANRKNNNINIRKKIIKDHNLVREYSPFDEFSFKNIKNKIIGSDNVLDEIDFRLEVGKNFVCVNFYNCKFQNIKFVDCSFIGCNFNRCMFESGGVVFENCTFTKSDSIKTPSLNIKDNFSATFEECKIYAKFKGCDLSYSIFENSILKNTSFELSNMQAVIVTKCDLHDIEVCDSDFQKFKTCKCYINNFKFNDKYMTTFDEKTFFDKLIERKKDRDEYEGIYTVYQNIADKYKQNNLNSNFGEYYYLAKKEEHKTLGFLPKLESYLYWFSCGYGERPIYSIYTSLFIIFLFAFLYLIFGIEIHEQLVQYSNLQTLEFLSIDKLYRDFKEAFFLSVSLFTGVGGENSIAALSSYFWADIEMLIGVIMTGIGTGTLIRKIIR